MIRYVIHIVVTVAIVTAVMTRAYADIESQIAEVYSNAIVKIDVSALEPVFVDGVNICLSEGTGFIIGERYVVTATHVHQLDQSCKQIVIVIKSEVNKTVRIAKIIGQKNDVSVLEADKTFTSPQCALRIYTKDVYSEKAIRFGIPGTMRYPAIFHVDISAKQNNFSPLLTLTPAATEKGESGGPVVFQFNVVGITRAKHDKFPAFSVMTPGEMLRSILSDLKLKLGGSICNPAEVAFFGGDHSQISSIQITPNDSLKGDAPVVDDIISQKTTEELEKVRRQQDSIERKSDKGTIVLHSSGAIAHPMMRKRIERGSYRHSRRAARSRNRMRRHFDVNRSSDVLKKLPTSSQKASAGWETIADDIQRSVEIELWNRLVKEGTDSKKWPSDKK